jgi:exopolysaccharide biosynthesis protein
LENDLLRIGAAYIRVSDERQVGYIMRDGKYYPDEFEDMMEEI